MRGNKDLVLAGTLALVLSFSLFGNGIGGDFVFDDTIVIVGNPFVEGKLANFSEIFTTPYFAYQPRPGLYRPLTIASYAINAFIFGISPASFHVINILLHALASFLVFSLIYRFSNRASAIAGFLLFMFLPIHTEAVTSIVGRAEILSFIFVVGALILSLKKSYIFASILFFLGLLSKEIAVTFLPVFLFLEIFDSRNSRSLASGWKPGFKKAIKNLCYFVPAFVLYSILRFVALKENFLTNDATPVYNPIKFASFFTGAWTSFKVFFLYLYKTFIPLSLSTDYSFNQIPLVKNPFYSLEALAGIAVLLFLIVLFFKTRNFPLKFGIILFLSSYFVISNWLFKTGTIMAERLMYMPSLGLAILVAVLIQNAKIKNQNDNVKIKNSSRRGGIPKFYILIFTFLILLSWYGYVIIDRNKDWADNASLYKSAYAAAPNSIVNRTNRAYLDFVEGKYAEAEARIGEVLNDVPDHVPALNLAAQNYKKLGQYQKAEELWKEAIKLRSDYLRAYFSLGVLYYESSYFKSAEKVLTESINIYPRWSEVLFLALAKTALDNPDGAIELIKKYFGNEPQREELKFALGWAYFNKGDQKTAERYFEEVKDPKMKMEDFIKIFAGSKIVILGEF